MSSFLYPRTVAVRRPDAALSDGVQPGYGGLDPAAERPVLSGLPASIQESATAGATGAQLPSDARSATTWRVFVPKRACADPAAIRTRDVLVDDLGRRFQIVAAYFNSLGWNCRVERLEV